MQTKIAQLISTNNDSNGNPRRAWFVYQQDETAPYFHPINVITIVYSGMPDEVKNICHLPSMHLAPSEYRNILKRYAHRITKRD